MPDLYSYIETHLTIEQIAARLGLAILFGGIIGLNREWVQKPAGLRTHIMVALASATFAVLAREMFLDAVDEGGRPDPVRVVEAVVTGVAFLGAGTIIRQSGDVAGVTTGASIWLVGAIGVATGTGHYVVAAMCTACGIVTLIFVDWLENRLIRPLARKAQPEWYDDNDHEKDRDRGGKDGAGASNRRRDRRDANDQGGDG